MAVEASVLDVTEATFERVVLQRSYDTPVVVDFWAPWCGPCRALGPTLERLAQSAQGSWQLVKLNTDENQALAQRYRIQSIPAVKAFRNGQVVDEFIGAQPEPAVRAFLQRLIPSGADQAVDQAGALLEAGNTVGAERLLRAALAEGGDHPQALLSLAQLLLDRGETQESSALLERIPAGTPESQQAAGLYGRLRFLADAARLPSREEAAAQLAANPGDLDALWALGVQATAAGSYREALEYFLSLITKNRRYNDDAGRKAMIAVFAILGLDHLLTAEFRPRLSAALH